MTDADIDVRLRAAMGRVPAAPPDDEPPPDPGAGGDAEAFARERAEAIAEHRALLARDAQPPPPGFDGGVRGSAFHKRDLDDEFREALHASRAWMGSLSADDVLPRS